MTNHDAAVLGIRLSALYAGFMALSHFSAALLFAIQLATFQGQVSMAWPIRLAQFIPCALLVVLAIFLFRKAPALARHFLPESGNSASAPGNPVNAMSVGFGIAGIVGLIFSIPRIIPSITFVFQNNSWVGPTFQQFLTHLPQIAAGVIQAVVCFWILVRSRALAEWWTRKQQ